MSQIPCLWVLFDTNLWYCESNSRPIWTETWHFPFRWTLSKFSNIRELKCKPGFAAAGHWFSSLFDIFINYSSILLHSTWLVIGHFPEDLGRPVLSKTDTFFENFQAPHLPPPPSPSPVWEKMLRISEGKLVFARFVTVLWSNIASI